MDESIEVVDAVSQHEKSQMPLPDSTRTKIGAILDAESNVVVGWIGDLGVLRENVFPSRGVSSRLA